MYCLRYWARYVCKGELKSGGIKIGNKSDPIQVTAIHNTHKEKIERFLARKGFFSGGALSLNTLCKGCSSHTTLVGLLYPRGDKSEKVCTGVPRLSPNCVV